MANTSYYTNVDHQAAVSHRTRNILCGLLLLIIAGLIGARLYLNVWLPRYVNNVLNNIEGYEGSIKGIDIDLYRGAYRIHQLELYKENGNIPTPFIAIDTIDLSIQWRSLIHGRIVSSVDLEKPVLNFAVNPTGAVAQTGKDVDWTKPIKDLAPIDINYVTFKDGSLTFQDFSTTPRVNVYIHHMHGRVDNLRNVVSKDQPLPSTLEIAGDSIGNGALNIDGRMNILKEVPDMDLNLKLEKVQLTALSNYSNAYAAIDIKGGNLDLYSEMIVKNNQVSGYIKPIATHISLVDLNKESNPIKVTWEALVSGVLEIFTNHRNEQFATKIPLEGRLDSIGTDTWSTIGGIIRNAFVAAFKKGFDNNGMSQDKPLDKKS